MRSFRFGVPVCRCLCHTDETWAHALAQCTNEILITLLNIIADFVRLNELLNYFSLQFIFGTQQRSSRRQRSDDEQEEEVEES